jgi:hypothetical protein
MAVPLDSIPTTRLKKYRQLMQRIKHIKVMPLENEVLITAADQPP